jgi:hypothetical protein
MKRKKIMKIFDFLKKLSGKLFTTKVGFIVLGTSSIIWFLIRVIPKPQRAAYPCMQAAAPIMSGMVIYLLSLFGSVAAYRFTIKSYYRANYFIAFVFLVAAFIFSFFLFIQEDKTVFANVNTTSANVPVGVGQGLFPGKVVWIFDPSVAKFDGKNGNWWDDSNTMQVSTDRMMKESLLSLTSINNEAGAWDALFKHFNLTKKNQSNGYAAGQKIAIKINQNNTSTTGQSNTKNINATPQLVLSLLRSLIFQAGVPQNRITVFDASRFITDNLFNKCKSEFPEVIFVDNMGGNGRIKATYIDNSIPFSVDNGALARGIASCAVEADYLINMALLKGHGGQGVTLCGKNYYGATSIFSSPSKNSHNNFSPEASGKDRYMTFVDYLGHKDLGGKTMLFMIDGIYASKTVSGTPTLKWKMKPFNNRWPSSLFVSQDAVAIDAVGLDFLRAEWPDMVDIKYAEKYLIEAALADNPPSKTVYDPEQDKVSLKSLGVMESWNNTDQKQYSRNLGKNIGIDLKFIDLSALTTFQTINEESVKVFPNPARNWVSVLNCNPQAEINIFDLNGKIIVQSNLSNNRFYVGGIAKGSYFIQIKDNKLTFAEKIYIN